MSDHSQPQVLAPPPPEEIRAELEHLVLANIIGPEGGEHEELPGTVQVRDHYLVGMLAPRQVVVSPQQMDKLAVEGTAAAEEATPDAAAPAGPSLFPSSLGMTFGLSADATEVELDARWGRYERTTTDQEDDAGKPRRVWRRHPGGGVLRHRLSDGDFGPMVADPSQEGVIVRGRVRRDANGWLVTAFLVNEQEDPPRNSDEAWLFQASLAASHPAGEPSFRRTLPGGSALDDPLETRALDMAYRDHVEFALGHGIGVHAEADPADPRRAFSVRTVAVPTYEVPRTDPPSTEDFPALAGAELDMAALADTPDEALAPVLRPLVDAYEEWITGQRARIGREDARLEGHEATAQTVLDHCQAMAARIRSGIEVLDPAGPAFDPLAAEARFAKRAMVEDHDGGDGVGVLMRYTLRLLTVQQFQRVAALMCACERIRSRPSPGATPAEARRRSASVHARRR